MGRGGHIRLNTQVGLASPSAYTPYAILVPGPTEGLNKFVDLSITNLITKIELTKMILSLAFWPPAIGNYVLNFKWYSKHEKPKRRSRLRML